MYLIGAYNHLQPSCMTHEISPEECLQLAAQAVGTPVQVGHAIRPDMDPKDAGKWLMRCLDDEHAQRLNYGQERLVYRLACQQGEHEGFRAYAESIGYRIEPIDQRAEIAAMAQRAEKLAKQSSDLSAEVMARMEASHVNVGAIA